MRSGAEGSSAVVWVQARNVKGDYYGSERRCPETRRASNRSPLAYVTVRRRATAKTLDDRGESAGLHGESPAHAVNRPVRAVTLRARAATLPGYAVTLPAYAVTLPAYAVTLP